MICLNKNELGAELLTAYLAKTLDAAGMAEVENHLRGCAECRGLADVWARLDEFSAPEVSAGFDARLYARIAAEDARRASGWRRWLWRPAIPLVAAGALAGLALLMVPRTPDVAKTSPTIEIEQVAQALDDMELLTSLDR
jgi:anti-sigma factor RsiW